MSEHTQAQASPSPPHGLPWVREMGSVMINDREGLNAAVVYSRSAADYVTKAVNSHAALVDALREAREALVKHGGHNPAWTDCPQCVAVAKIDAALKLAGKAS